jgi:hypothetical protein
MVQRLFAMRGFARPRVATPPHSGARRVSGGEPAERRARTSGKSSWLADRAVESESVEGSSGWPDRGERPVPCRRPTSLRRQDGRASERRRHERERRRSAECLADPSEQTQPCSLARSRFPSAAGGRCSAPLSQNACAAPRPIPPPPRQSRGLLPPAGSLGSAPSHVPAAVVVVSPASDPVGPGVRTSLLCSSLLTTSLTFTQSTSLRVRPNGRSWSPAPVCLGKAGR